MSELSGPRVDPRARKKWDDRRYPAPLQLARKARPGRVGKVEGPPCVDTELFCQCPPSRGKRKVPSRVWNVCPPVIQPLVSYVGLLMSLSFTIEKALGRDLRKKCKPGIILELGSAHCTVVLRCRLYTTQQYVVGRFFSALHSTWATRDSAAGIRGSYFNLAM